MREISLLDAIIGAEIGRSILNYIFDYRERNPFLNRIILGIVLYIPERRTREINYKRFALWKYYRSICSMRIQTHTVK